MDVKKQQRTEKSTVYGDNIKPADKPVEFDEVSHKTQVNREYLERMTNEVKNMHSATR